MDVTALDTIQIRELLTRKQVSAEELVQAHFKRIEANDQTIRAYLSLSPERALQQAKRIDRLIATGEPLPALAGVPIAIKDVILTRGVRSTCASKILANFIPPYDATVVSRIEAAGACILGKTNCD